MNLAVENCGNVDACTCTPCRPLPTNSAACELLSSQVENFARNFYGEIIKTELNGEVSWSLPCRLNTGLPGNPRYDSEPLGCYFYRLLRDGIVGLAGPVGFPGATGHPGTRVIQAGPDGVAIGGAVGPAGPTGPIGATGPQGPAGSVGAWYPQTGYGSFGGDGDAAIPDTYALLTAGTVAMKFTVPVGGIYWVCYAGLTKPSALASLALASFKLRNTTTSSDIPASVATATKRHCNGPGVAIYSGVHVSRVSLVTAATNDVIELWGQYISGPPTDECWYGSVRMTYFRIA